MKLKYRLLSVIAAVGIGAGLTACGGNSVPYYDTICVNPLTQIRMPDLNCSSSWLYYVPYGYVSPGYGVHITNYNTNYYNRPAKATIHTGGVPSSGGKATKFKSGNTTVKPTSKPKNQPTKVNLQKNTSKTNTGSKPKVNTGGGSKKYGSVKVGKR